MSFFDKINFCFYASAPTLTPLPEYFLAQWCILSWAEAGNERSGVVECGVHFWHLRNVTVISSDRHYTQICWTRNPFFHCLPLMLLPASAVFALCPFLGLGSFFATSSALTANVSKLGSVLNLTLEGSLRKAIIINYYCSSLSKLVSFLLSWWPPTEMHLREHCFLKNVLSWCLNSAASEFFIPPKPKACSWCGREMFLTSHAWR